MTHRVRYALLTVLCLAIASSSSYAKEKITFLAKDSTKYSARPADCEVEMFAEAKPEQPYVEIGVVNYHEERHRTRDGALKIELALPKIKASACKNGVDALMDVRVTEVRRLEFVMYNIRATAVRFETK
jgi:hypothetical protein